ncbi:MAG: glycosyltransferase family 39 protein [Planctomycetota bacterium]
MSARPRPHLGLLLVLAVFFGFAATAPGYTSTTFDEILPTASGASGWRYGRYDRHLAHPPLAQYSYGWPLVPLIEHYPDETADWPLDRNYGYARELWGNLGNPTERMARVARFPAAVWGLLALLGVYWGAGGARRGGLWAAGFLAFLPDHLAHSGVAYNDVILTATLPLAWSQATASCAGRRPAPGLAGVTLGSALASKFTAVLLGPIALGCLVLEACARRERRPWLAALLPGAALGALCLYLTLVVFERGDPTLELWRAGLAWTLHPPNAGTPASYLFGQERAGTPLFYLVAYAVKLPLATHAVILLGLGLFARARWRGRRTWRRWLRARWRGPLMGVALFVLVFARTPQNNGLRYALPAFALLAVWLGPVWARAWRRAQPHARWAWGALWAAGALSALLAWPHFLGYMNALVPVERRHEVLVESSLDWGQGLIELRDYLEEAGYPGCHLAYFGSCAPASYGLRYRPLPGFLQIPPLDDPPTGPLPVAISATVLVGLYLPGDPYAAYRQEEPLAVLAGGSLLVYAPRER